MSVGELIVAWRQRAGMSQWRLAREAGIDRSYMSRIESGQRRPSYPVLVQIARALSLDEAEFDELLQAAGYPSYSRKRGG